MATILPSEFEEWKIHPVTEEFMNAIISRIGDASDILSSSAGLDRDQDNFYRGFIHAYRECLMFRVDDSVSPEEIE